LEMTILSPMFNLKMVITVLLGYFFLGEVLTSKKVWLIAMIVVAGMFATTDERFSIKSFLDKKIFLAIFLMFFTSVLTIFINRTINQNGYWTATLWMVTMSIVFSFILNFPLFYKDLKKTKLSDYGWIPILAIIGGIGDLAAYKALEENVGISSIIICLPFAMMMSIILAFWKPELMEKHTAKVYVIRVVAAGIMIFGAINLSR
jgi:drug/metabolite transporter (DMT)-like permease